MDIDTTQEDFISQLRAGAENNMAIRKHLDKVLAMTPEQWVAHRESLIARSKQFEPTARRLAAEMVRNRRWPVR